ncbi:hypothetical protein BX600DRAFT_492608 [Xylariales sp. PMI_506]|nr:hypothetical protein BX600DRAFT_492608 [Xylariales sp. PMI_506]
MATTFHRFSELPMELQLATWTHHFRARRVNHLCLPDDVSPFLWEIEVTTPSGRRLRSWHSYKALLTSRIAYQVFLETFKVVSYDWLDPPPSYLFTFPMHAAITTGRHPDFDSLQHWEIAARERREELRSRGRRLAFPINLDLDLVYLAHNPGSPTVLRRFLAMPWAVGVRRLAVLFSFPGMQWFVGNLKEELDLLERELKARGSTTTLELEEFYLVMHRTALTRRLWRNVRRDAYGFIAYTDARPYLCIWDRLIMDRQYRRVEDVFTSKPQLFEENLRIRWVIDPKLCSPRH